MYTENIESLTHELDNYYNSKAKDHSLFNLQKLPNQTTYDNQPEVTLVDLELFVREVLSTHQAAFLFDTQDRQYKPSSSIAYYFRAIPEFIQIVKALNDRYEYSEHINVFIACTRALGLQDVELNWQNDLSEANKIDHRFNHKWTAACFNDLVYEIRNTWKTNSFHKKSFQDKFNSRQEEANNRLEGYCHYVNELFKKYARLVVIRIDLFYQKSITGNKSASDIAKDLKHLTENKRNNQSLFADMAGYIAKLEYGHEKGLHWHMLFFFDGSKRSNSSHIYLAKAIGEYWKHTVTKGQGDYWNANANIDDYQRKGLRGIGTINYNEKILRGKLEYIVSYLCKTGQYFKPKFYPKVRLFRRGNYPEFSNQKLGRPRSKLEQQTA